MKPIIALLACLSPTAAAAEPLDAFPKPQDGMVRHVIELAEIDNPELARIELVVGKRVRTDGTNRHFFSGKIETGGVEGWGYTYYQVTDLGPMGGTLMAALPGRPPVDQFVTLGSQPFLVRYNPSLPIVVYLPKGAELRYRIWKAQEQLLRAEIR